MTALSMSLSDWMEAEAIRLTPPNKFWYIQRWLDNSKIFGKLVILAFLVGILIAFFLVPKDILGVSHTALDYVTYGIAVLMFGGGPVFIAVFVPLTVIIVAVRDPKRWQWYSVADFTSKWDIIVPPLAKKIREIRAQHPEAEFYVAVFQKKCAVDTFDYLLLMEQFDELGCIHTFQKGGKPVLLLDSQFREIPLP
ncbi:MAG TPA: hypothetical protein VG934_03460 [Candidatus Paceibacterota bacterium]|nr:hypothetical protein [Candidatus Paceibacterota bacterium]